MQPTDTAQDAVLHCLRRLAERADPVAWGMLLELVGPSIHRLAARLTGDPALADDAVQETLLRVRDSAASFRSEPGDGDQVARRWILAIAAHTSLNLVRQRRRARARERRAGEQQASAHAAPDVAVERDEMHDAIRVGLAGLPEAKRTSVALRVVAGLSYDDIAAQLSVPVGTAKARVHRGLEDLRRRLARAGFALSLAAVSGLLAELPAAEATFDAAACAQLLTAKAVASTTSALPVMLTTAAVIAASAVALGCMGWTRADASAPPSTVSAAAASAPAAPIAAARTGDAASASNDSSAVRLDPYFYVYELTQPTLSARDEMGTIALSVRLPPGDEHGLRVSSERDQKWERTTTQRTLRNSGRLLGVQLETRIGQGAWRPSMGPGILDGGFMPLDVLEKNGGAVSIPVEVMWQRHSFRVRTVVAATGFTGERADADETVLVFDASERRFDPPEDWRSLVTDWRSDAASFKARWVEGARRTIPGVTLADDELVYLGGGNAPAEAAVQATAETRFALEKIFVDPADPSKEVAVFLLTKQFKGRDEAANAWLDHPEVFKLCIGETLGDVRVIIPPGGKLKAAVDLTTPFRLAEIRHDVDRIWYYELKLKPRAPAAKDKDLEIIPMVKKTDVAVLKNDRTGETVELVRLADVRRPTRAGVISYPTYPVEVYEEDKEFLTRPAEFQQWGLKPPEPVMHAAGSGPLQDLRDRTGDSIYSTDTSYIEMPDGRLFWWEPTNHLLMQWPENNGAGR
jgi:RNA polymerase sigma-70 factor (ECF subfamily)